ncbi:ribonuclease P protein component 4 [Nanoarchaeota archaeon]
MARRYQKKPQRQRALAMEHMKDMFERAKNAGWEKKSLANRYVTLARKIAMKLKLRIPSEYKRLYCKHCYKFLMPGKNLRVRVHESRVIYYCLECKKFWRKPVR